MASSILDVLRAIVLAALIVGTASTSAFLVGMGIADATGPAADVCFMGYANPSQTAAGIHFRLRARAFVIGDDDGKNRVAYVSADIGMGSQALTREVISRLGRRFPGQYSLHNVFISGTHTHAAPGGYSQYLVHQIGSEGFVPETFETYARAITDSIIRAHLSAIPKSKVFSGMGKAYPGSNINRSPSAYRANPQAERDMYEKDGGNTDKIFAMLKFVRPDGVPMGMFNWFSVHGTSMPNDNRLISGDNKGYASQLFEEWMNGKDVLPGNGPFVAGFAATNLGDVSPNVNGTFCQTSGLPCEEATSTCKGFSEFCHGRGPGRDAFESTKIIGERQAMAARDAFNSLKQEIDKPQTVWSAHRIVDFSNVKVDLGRVGQLLFPSPKMLIANDVVVENIKDDADFELRASPRRRTTMVEPPEWTKMGTVNTCKAALGFSFAAGTTDGPGIFDFYQGETRGKPFWESVRNFIFRPPSNESKKCQSPKPIFLPVGEAELPYAWEPSVMSIGIAVFGKSFALLSVPSEFSTMAGRRLKRAVKKALVDAGRLSSDGIVALSCLTNAYSHYVTTFEEYSVQRYEGASTLYGPHTLAAYIQEFLEMIDGKVATPADEEKIPNLLPKAITLLAETNFDRTEQGKPFGAPTVDAGREYFIGDTVYVEFLSANLRHDARSEDTFLTVEFFSQKLQRWVVIATDSSFDTKLYYSRRNDVSTVEVEWQIPADAKTGSYRISHRASYKTSGKTRLTPFVGYSRVFKVSNGMAE